MKLKNINPFQKYVDFMVIGLAVLIGLYVLWSYVLSNPYAVEYNAPGNTRVVSPAELPRLQRELARQLEAGVNSDRNPLGELPTDIYEYYQEFVTRLSRSHMNEKLAFGSHGLADGMVELTGGEAMAYYVPAPPAPEQVRGAASYGVLAPQEELVATFAADIPNVRDNRAATREATRLAEQLLALVGNPNPRDFQYITVGAEFDLAALLERYNAPAKGGLQKLPDNWWWGSLVITDVILERETYDEASQQWVDRTRVPLLPGQPDLRTRRESYDPATVEVVMATLAQYQHDLSNPPFPPLAEYSRPWRSPFSEQKDLTIDERREIMTLRKRISDTERALEQLGQTVNRRNRPVQPQRRPTSIDDPAGIGGPRPTRPTQPTTRPNPTQVQRDPNAERLARLQEQLQRDQERYAELTGEDVVFSSPRQRQFNPRMFMGPEQYGAFPGGFMPMEPGYPGGPGVYGPNVYPGGNFPRTVRQPQFPGLQGGDPSVEEPADGRVHVWAHDLTVEPGREYRYRVIVCVLNPLFQRRNLTEEQQETYYNTLSLESEPSEWTEPIRTRAVPQWFVDSVNPNTQQATVEVWRVFDGMPSSVKFTVAPGDPIGREVTMQGNDGIDRTVRVDVPVVVVDTYTEANSLGSDVGALLYLDTVTKVLKSRRPDIDRNSDARLELESERMLRGEVADGTQPGGTRPNVRPAGVRPVTGFP